MLDALIANSPTYVIGMAGRIARLNNLGRFALKNIHEMEKITEKIDKFIRDADRKKNFGDYFEDYVKLNQELADVYKALGRKDSLVHPNEGSKWLREQAEKLTNFLFTYQQ